MISLWNRVSVLAGPSSKRARKSSALSVACLTSEWRRARSEQRRAFLVSRSCSQEEMALGRMGGMVRLEGNGVCGSVFFYGISVCCDGVCGSNIFRFVGGIVIFLDAVEVFVTLRRDQACDSLRRR